MKIKVQKMIKFNVLLQIATKMWVIFEVAGDFCVIL